MKKLMIGLAAAGLCSAVFADVTSANIVGYLKNSVGSLESPGIGMVFTPINGASTYMLKEITVESSNGKYMSPINEYLQKLDDATDVEGRYTYISEAYLKATFTGTAWKDDYLDAIGWWNWDSSWRTQFKSLIQNGNYGHKCTDAETTFDVGTAFLANFSGKNGLVFVSSGAAPKSLSITIGSLESPFIANFVPRKIDINEIEVTSNNGKYMSPINEYLQKLDDATDVIGRYTYISEAYLKATFTGTAWKDDYLDAIGWWNWDSSWRTQFKTLIQNGNYSHKIKTLDVNPSDSFLGNFSGKNGLVFKFPDSVKAN